MRAFAQMAITKVRNRTGIDGHFMGDLLGTGFGPVMLSISPAHGDGPCLRDQGAPHSEGGRGYPGPIEMEGDRRQTAPSGDR